MKKLIIALLVFAIGGQIYAQETDLFIAKLKKNEVPKVILNAVDRDFSNLTAVEFLTIPESYAVPATVDIQNYESSGFDSYVVTFAGKTEKIMATYNRKGKLVSSVDRYETKNAPSKIYQSVGKLFPEWIVNDGYKKMRTYDANGKEKNLFYKLTLVNGKKIKKIYLNKDGDLANSIGKSKM